ncbi:hypothetical protein [Pelosinus sp. UFO1]|uniref:hypothetical protein n=1 Tax=Pelosinus sp. UFO1 TaxID=484770 RepID=UPI0004D1B79B|nr:hypothetical protein [Pelosinus sp. UFO1]AIF51946.1 hypothetical protein UFO1_2399 [Pelosinus sp. UFO1]
MRFFTLTVIFLLLSFSQAFAISPVNIDVIKEAQDYGKSNAQNQLKDFLLPWMSYEEKAIKLNDTAERSYLYTSFLLIATDAREKNLLGRNVTALDSESILADYSGLLSFSTVLFGGKQDFTQNANVVLKQAGKEIKAYQVVIPSKAEKNTGESGQNTFTAQCYFYFIEKDIVLDIPIILLIKTNDKIEHSFYFDIAKIK